MARLRVLALLLKLFGYGGRFPNPCTNIMAEAIGAQPFLLGAGTVVCVCIKLRGFLMLDFENTWPSNVLL